MRGTLTTLEAIWNQYMQPLSTYVLVWHEEDMAELSKGTDPVDALRKHYEDVDLYCESSDGLVNDFIERFQASAYLISPKDEENVQKLFDDIENSEPVDAVTSYLKGLPNVESWVVRAEFRNGMLYAGLDGSDLVSE